jgi:hypothetical protein
MPTVKLQNGKVVTKSGKVACSCCEPDCCMYPADDYITWMVPPEEVVLGGSTLTVSMVYNADLGEDVPVYGDTTNGVMMEQGAGVIWAVYIEGVRTTQTCLFAGAVSDNFNPTYYHVFDGRTISMNRMSLCVWDSGILDTLPCTVDSGGNGTNAKYIHRLRLFWIPYGDTEANLIDRIGGWEYGEAPPFPIHPSSSRGWHLLWEEAQTQYELPEDETVPPTDICIPDIYGDSLSEIGIISGPVGTYSGREVT